MARAARGDRGAWRSLYARHRDHVFRMELRFLGQEPAARDVAQEVFISLFAHARSYRPRGSFLRYLRRMTVNRCMNVRASAHESRRVMSADAVRSDLADGAPSAQELLERDETAAAVQAAIAGLPARQRMAVVLSRFEGMSYDEIAAVLECSISSVESLLFRARQALARALSRA